MTNWKSKVNKQNEKKSKSKATYIPQIKKLKKMVLASFSLPFKEKQNISMIIRTFMKRFC